MRPDLAGRLVVPGKHSQRGLEHHLGRARGPQALTLHRLEAFQEAAYVDEQTGQFRSDGLERLVDALARRKCRIGQVGDAVRVRRRPDAAVASQLAPRRCMIRPRV